MKNYCSNVHAPITVCRLRIYNQRGATLALKHRSKTRFVKHGWHLFVWVLCWQLCKNNMLYYEMWCMLFTAGKLNPGTLFFLFSMFSISKPTPPIYMGSSALNSIWKCVRKWVRMWAYTDTIKVLHYRSTWAAEKRWYRSSSLFIWLEHTYRGSLMPSRSLKGFYHLWSWSNSSEYQKSCNNFSQLVQLTPKFV